MNVEDVRGCRGGKQDQEFKVYLDNCPEIEAYQHFSAPPETKKEGQKQQK